MLGLAVCRSPISETDTALGDRHALSASPRSLSNVRPRPLIPVALQELSRCRRCLLFDGVLVCRANSAASQVGAACGRVALRLAATMVPKDRAVTKTAVVVAESSDAKLDRTHQSNAECERTAAQTRVDSNGAPIWGHGMDTGSRQVHRPGIHIAISRKTIETTGRAQ